MYKVTVGRGLCHASGDVAGCQKRVWRAPDRLGPVNDNGEEAWQRISRARGTPAPIISLRWAQRPQGSVSAILDLRDDGMNRTESALTWTTVHQS